MSLFSAPTFEHYNQFIIVCFAHDELMVDWSGRRLLREKRDRRDPAGAKATRRLGARPRKASAWFLHRYASFETWK